MNRFFTNPRVTLPLAIVLGLVTMGMRAADMWDVVAEGKLSLRPAMAESAPKKETATQAAPAEPAPMPAQKAANKEIDTISDTLQSLKAPEANDSPGEIEVLKQLSERREQLEARARDLDSREALIKVAEQRVDQKLKEMETLRNQLQAMVNQAAGAQQAQLDNLVKIYETMKPDEAAKIFDTLDMPVLLGVFQRMKPARTAPIMAKMSPDRAKEVTIALTKQDQLPQLK